MERRFPVESVQILLQGFGTVPVEGHSALVGCAVAVRTSGGAVGGEGIPESGGGQKVVKEIRAKIRERRRCWYGLQAAHLKLTFFDFWLSHFR